MEGIIYCAMCLVSNKRYIGSTIQSLEKRKRQHTTKALRGITGNYKFPNALRKYAESDWQWSVLAEVEIANLTTVEREFILQFNSVNEGYNTVLSTDSKRKSCYDSKEVFNLFHPVFGFVSKTRDELRELDSKVLKYLSGLMSGMKISYYGWRKVKLQSMVSLEQDR